MKLRPKDQKKIGIVLLVTVGVIYAYFSFIIWPLNDEQVKINRSLRDLLPKIKLAKDQIARKDALEKTYPEAKDLLDKVTAMIPQGAPVAWFPPRIEDIAKRFDLKMTVNMGVEAVARHKKYKQIIWNIAVPSADFVSLCRSIQTIENEEPLVDVTGIEIIFQSGEKQSAGFGIVSITK